jgi:hypothetical protein
VNYLLALLVGLCTLYNEPGVTRSGDIFSPDTYTCAVDDTEFGWLIGRTLAITADEVTFIYVKVNDSGYLYKAGRFRFDAQAGYYLPSSTGYPVVVDLPEHVFRKYFSTTTLVRVYLVQEGDIDVYSPGFLSAEQRISERGWDIPSGVQVWQCGNWNNHRTDCWTNLDRLAGYLCQ